MSEVAEQLHGIAVRLHPLELERVYPADPSALAQALDEPLPNIVPIVDEEEESSMSTELLQPSAQELADLTVDLDGFL